MELKKRIISLLTGVIFLLIIVIMLLIFFKSDKKEEKAKENELSVEPIIATFIGESNINVPFNVKCNNNQIITLSGSGVFLDEENNEISETKCNKVIYWKPNLNEEINASFLSNELNVPEYNFILEKYGNSYYISLK